MEHVQRSVVTSGVIYLTITTQWRNLKEELIKVAGFAPIFYQKSRGEVVTRSMCQVIQ